MRVTKRINLGQIHTKAVVSAVPRVKDIASPSYTDMFLSFCSSSAVPTTHEIFSLVPVPTRITAKYELT